MLEIKPAVETAGVVAAVAGDVSVKRFGPMQRFRRDRVALACGLILLTLIVVAVLADLLQFKDPDVQNITNRLQGPSGEHWLGTDTFGRDVYARMVQACRLTLLATAQGLGIAVLLGIPVGLLAGYVGGLADSILSRITDGLMALPPLIFGIAIIGILGPGLTNAMISVGIVLSPRFFRLARAAARSVSREHYIEAARADGCSTLRILVKHVLPNSLGPLLVQMTFGVGQVIIAEASLSYLGLGVQSPQSSWGSMIREGFNVVTTSKWLIVPPSVAVVVTIAASFLLGDGLRDAFGRGLGDK